MGRAERRRAERRNRIEERKGKVLLSHSEINEIRRTASNDGSVYGVEALMTCYALALRRLYKFGRKRINRSLNYINDLMDDILEDRATMEDFKQILEDETGIIIRCKD
jgi:hypothetical protein